MPLLTRIELYETDPEPCPRCLEAFDNFTIRYEGIQPLRGGAMDAMAHDGRKHCQDCAFAESLIRIASMPTWEHGRTALSNHRQESMRLPELPIGLGRYQARLSEVGEWAEHLKWLDARVMESCEIHPEPDKDPIPGYIRMCRWECGTKTPHYTDTDMCSVCCFRPSYP